MTGRRHRGSSGSPGPGWPTGVRPRSARPCHGGRRALLIESGRHRRGMRGADSRRVLHGAGEPGERPRREVAVARADRAEPMAGAGQRPPGRCVFVRRERGAKVMSHDVVQGIKRCAFRFETPDDLRKGVSPRSVPVKRVGQPIGRSDRPWPADSGALIPCTTWRDAIGPHVYMVLEACFGRAKRRRATGVP